MHLVQYILSPYTVCVRWGDLLVRHRARSYKDALDWARCYPHDAIVMIGRRGNLLASRGAIG